MAAPRSAGRSDPGAVPAEGTAGGAGSGGYVGSREKVQRSKKLFKRNELAMIGQAEGGKISGFTDCHFKVLVD